MSEFTQGKPPRNGVRVDIIRYFEAVLQAPDIDTIWRTLCAKMESYGFDRLFYGFTRFRVGENLGSPSDMLILSNHPQDYLDRFFDQGHYQNAPMVRWTTWHEGACSWRLTAERAQKNELSPEEVAVIDLNHQFGIRAGYSIGFSESSSRARGGLGLCARAGLCQDDVDAIWEKSGREIEIMAKLAHLRITSMPFATARRALTDRQREVLEWVADGKTTADIATIMGLTLSTVEKHLRLAREALEVETTAQAVLKASVQRQIFLRGHGPEGSARP